MNPEKSPLLPLRHEPDFFVCDVFDSAFKGDQASMAHPVFSLSKKRDMTTRRYENNGQWVEVRPSSKGLATVFDRDVIIYCISQCVSRLNDGLPVPRTLQFKAYDLLVATNRDIRGGGRSYNLLRDALDRLQGTQIATNIVTGGEEELDVFSLIDRYKIVRETRDGRMQDVQITLSDWVFNAIEATEVLTLNKRYFQLARPLERRLYEIARKHCGDKDEWSIWIETLHLKTGSQSTLREFRRLLKAVIEDDDKHGHLPTYRFQLVDEGNRTKVLIRQKEKTPALFAHARLHVTEDTHMQSKSLAPGWDTGHLLSEWRDWVTTKKIEVRDPDAHFLSFCRKWFARRGRPS